MGFSGFIVEVRSVVLCYENITEPFFYLLCRLNNTWNAYRVQAAVGAVLLRTG
jgi:hypothetical protein